MKNNLKILRLQNNLTQVELADISGISKSQISRFEQGQAIKDEDIIKLCKALKISADYFLGLKLEVIEEIHKEKK